MQSMSKSRLDDKVIEYFKLTMVMESQYKCELKWLSFIAFALALKYCATQLG